MKSLLSLLGLFLFATSLYGQVGINNVSPNASLDISASDATDPSNTDGILIPRIDQFPTTDPGAAQNGMLIYLTTADGGNLPGFYFWNNGTTTWEAVGDGAGQINELSDGVNDGSSLFLGNGAGANDEGGNNNVGIGEQSLSAVNTGINNTAVGFGSLRADTWGRRNTAIGFSSMITNTTGGSNTAIGSQSMFSNTTGTVNIAIGTNALYYNDVGAWNVGIGGNSMFNISGSSLYNISIGGNSLVGANAGVSTSRNIAIGFESSRNIDTGADNIAIGYQALRTNSTGSFNVGIGNGVLRNSTTANFNTAIGYNAMNGNTTGRLNAAVGYNALTSNTTGITNAAFGYQAMVNNTTGSSNTAFGSHSLDGITTGGNNTAVGYASGSSNILGINNTYLGSGSGSNTNTGSRNTYLGAFTGSEAPGDGNVFIGYSAGYFETGSNQLHISNSITSTPLVLGDFTLGTFRINGTLTVGNPGNGYEFPSIDGTPNQILKSTGVGSLIWTTAASAVSPRNGVVGIGSGIGLGGTLTQTTSIDHGIYDLTHDLTSSGDFAVAASGTRFFEATAGSLLNIGGDTYWRNGSTTATVTGRYYDSSGAGILDLYNSSVRTRINSNGDSFFNGGEVGIGMTSPNNQLDVTDNTTTYVGDFYNTNTGVSSDGISVRLAASLPTTGAYYVGFFRNVGVTVAGRVAGTSSGIGVQYVTTSDARLKTNFQEVDGALSMISEINPLWYEFKSNRGYQEMGFLAQELNTVYPYAVSGEEDSDPETNPMMVDYGRITPLLTAGIQELEEKVINLEENVAQLQAENDALKASIAQYQALEARIAALEGNTLEKNNQASISAEK
ncbi:tail fiber domain-containing protein [Gilvibacter sediminis]|uniref:tail fiber domain-containing protein n=1 Tax=Gilvibacter sediminis TaxID=379071 RepID=UPI0023508A11|nr:tail fiber domain-containing protein [Gilvibacter sediminis]MDC7996456.1 tail fiber domain-containing protein [Gilvibacter sediminis]